MSDLNFEYRHDRGRGGGESSRGLCAEVQAGLLGKHSLEEQLLCWKPVRQEGDGGEQPPALALQMQLCSADPHRWGEVSLANLMA